MDPIEWNINLEAQLLESMIGHKPVGINKHFEMAFICEKFISLCEKDISSENVWTHLKSMYNLNYLNENETIPFPNSTKEFQLPESDFGALIHVKDEDIKTASKTGKDTSKKDSKKEDKTLNKSSSKDCGQRRDSKELTDTKNTTQRKERKRDSDKMRWKLKNSLRTENQNSSRKSDLFNKSNKRSTRGSLKPDDTSSNTSRLNASSSGMNKRKRMSS